jgi:hypothetical protein
MYISFKFPKAISKLMKCRNEPYYPSAPVHSKPYDPVPIPQKVNSRRSSSTSTEGTSDNEHSYGKRAWMSWWISKVKSRELLHLLKLRKSVIFMQKSILPRLHSRTQPWNHKKGEK